MTGETLTWLLTSTTYETWLPGDSRGFVGHVTDSRLEDPRAEHRHVHNLPGTDYDRGMPELRAASVALMKGEPIWLTTPQALAVISQFRETAKYRNWTLHALGHGEPFSCGRQRPGRGANGKYAP